MSQKQKQLKNDIKKLSEGILAKVTDLALVAVFYNLEIAFLKRSEWWKVERRVMEDLEEFNYEKLKRGLNQLRQKGLIQTIKEDIALPKITEAGLKKLRSLIPQYEEKRIWDGKLYLITYDLPVNKNKERNYLRNFLKKIGCGMMQQSLWITPYNPSKLLEEFIKEHGLSEDLILVSTLGRGGTIGEMEFPLLVEKVYHLGEINERYKKFIFDYRNQEKSQSQLVFQYLSILSDDPQLPFGLLPDWWEGDEAYKIFLKLNKNNQR